MDLLRVGQSAWLLALLKLVDVVVPVSARECAAVVLSAAGVVLQEVSYLAFSSLQRCSWYQSGLPVVSVVDGGLVFCMALGMGENSIPMREGVLCR